MTTSKKQRPFRKLEQLDDRIVPAGGLFDTTFDVDGKAFLVPPLFTNFTGSAAAMQADGKIVVVGSSQGLLSRSILVARLNADGTPDATFDTDGLVTIGTGAVGSFFAGNAVTIQPDGKIVVAGTAKIGADEDFYVARLKTDGSLDTSFATDGKRTISFNLGGADNDRANGVTLQADGKIVIVGEVQQGANDFDFGFARLLADGSLDPSFDFNGLKFVAFDLGGNDADIANAVTIDAAGKILAVGGAETAVGKSDFAVVRLNTDGSLDSNFDSDGKVSLNFGANDIARAVALTADGKIVVAGTWQGSIPDFAVARFTDLGALDTTFGGGNFAANSGKTNASFAATGFGNDEFATGVALDGLGRILVTGYTDNNVDGGPNNYGVIRFLANGSGVDPAFGLNGRSQADLGGDDKAFGFVQQSDGRMVLVGTTGSKIGVTRLTGDSADLGVTIVSTGSQFTLGSLVEYTVTVSNFGTETAVADLGVDLTTAVLTPNYTSTVTAGAPTGNTSGAGLPADRLTLPSGGQVTYRILGRIASALVPGAFTPTANIANLFSFDPDPADNTDVEADFAAPLTPVLAGGPINGSAVKLTPNAGVYTLGATNSFYPSTSTRTAAADVNGDGIADSIVGPGPGQQSSIRILDGVSGLDVTPTWNAFEDAFTGGVFVAARDLNGDGRAEVIVTPDVSGGPVTVVYDGAKLASGLSGEAAQIFRYFGIDDPAFRGGARPALGDVNGDGIPDFLIAAGFGGGPRVTFWDGASVLSKAPVQLANFFAFETALRNGAYIAAGDVDGDGVDDVSFGGGPGGAPRVRIYNGAGLIAAPAFGDLDVVPASAQIANFFAGSNTLRGGVRIVMKDVDADGRAELVTGSGDNEAATARVFNGVDLLTITAPVADQELVLFGGAILLNGVFVG